MRHSASKKREIIDPVENSSLPDRRLVSVDAGRGFCLLLLVAGELGIQRIVDVGGWAFLTRHFDHVEWEGLVLWDMGQAAFLWIVGVAIAFSLASRLERGATWSEITKRAAVRALTLFVLSQVILSVNEWRLHLQLTNVLTHIAVAYFVCVFLHRFRFSVQVAASLVLLVGYHSVFLVFPGSDGPFSQHDNIGLQIDAVLLGRTDPEGFVSISIVGGIVSTLLGMWSGMWVRGRPPSRVAIVSVVVGVVVLALGLALEAWIPVVRKLWTAPYLLQSLAWTLIAFSIFLLLVDILRWRRFVAPFVVLGSNPILVYCAFMLLAEPIDRLLWEIADGFEALGALAPLVRAGIIVAILFVPVVVLWRRKIFLRL